MSEEEKVPQNSGETNKNAKDPEGGNSGESEKKNTEALSNIPEHLSGKSVDDLVKMYGELERKLGEQSGLVGEAKKLKENQRLLADAIYSDSELAKKVEAALQKKLGISMDTGKKDKGDGDAASEVADLRRAHENRVINDFSEKFGLNKLKTDEKESILKKIGGELADMVDPTGNKPMAEVLKGVSLEKLPKLLEKAYYLATMDDVMSGKDDVTRFASIGRVSSSSSGSSDSDDGLTQSELDVAKKLGIDPEKYKKRKKEINK